MNGAKRNAAGLDPDGVRTQQDSTEVIVTDHDRDVYQWAQRYWPDVPATWVEYRAYYEHQWAKGQMPLEGL